MLETVPYALEELLRERREGSVRAVVRAVGYALARGGNAEDVGHFLFDSYRLAGDFQRRLQTDGDRNGAAFAARHILMRWGWCDDVQVREEQGGLLVESASLLQNHEAVLGFHGVTRMDMEACMETFWRLSGQALGLEVTYTVGDDRDWAVIRGPGGAPLAGEATVKAPAFTTDRLAAHRRIALATGITFSIGYAKYKGDEPEQLGQFFYKVWEEAGHYDRLRERWGYGNAMAYAQSMARSRQVLYTWTEMVEDLDGYTISSPSWATEIPQIMGTFGCLPDDVYRYYLGGGVAACIKLGLQYADRSDDRNHRVWIRSR
jgi:hypothetical protein